MVVDAPGALDHKATRVHFVTDGYVSIIGLRPPYGSALPATTPNASVEAQFVGVISNAMWEDAFGRNDVRNLTVTVNGISVQIVGVAPARFTGVLGAKDRSMLWLPLAARAAILAAHSGANSSPTAALSSADSTSFEAVGRLQPGVSLEQATAAVRVVAANAVSQMTPPRTMGWSAAKPPVFVYDADVIALRGMDAGMAAAMGLPAGDSRSALLAAVATVSTLLLLVVCTNVAALVISAAVGRRQEIAVRLSLGASRARVIRQLLTESTVLAMMGGALGLLVYWLVIVAISQIPTAEFFRPDLGTVAFTMCVALGTGTACGLAPALHATRAGVGAALKDTTSGATRRSRLQHTFVIAQVMFTQPLLVLIASLLIGLVTELEKPLPDRISDRVLRLEIDMGTRPGTLDQKRDALTRSLQSIRETPGVATVLSEPVSYFVADLVVRAEDRGTIPRAASPVQGQMRLVTPGYFDLLGVPLLRGNDLVSTSDTSETMIIGSELARQLWGDADPIGRRFTQITPPEAVKQELVVSGVYDSRYFDRGNIAIVYRTVNRLRSGAYLIRTVIPAPDLAVSIRRIVREELPSTPIEPLVTLAQIQTVDRRGQRALQGGVAAGGVLVLLLSSIGLYGAVALGVGQRRREIGVRMALGARAGQVVALFYAGGVRLGVIGLVLGLPISLVALYFLERQGNQASAGTPPSTVILGTVVGALVLAVASVATLIPAARAARVNPVIALRSE